ncbi:hypothetical protein [Radiobacillus sp. PE A8.2]|uniref:hypothetical protein n=1 Tax=Radiobacillus sp. PE A8.2 TaxID=3380349 RepID=UPI00388E7DC0
MLDELSTQLFEAENLNPVWPNELLELSKDTEYDSVLFKKANDFLEVELKFHDEGQEIILEYVFDEEDLLQYAYLSEHGTKSTVFDRQLLISDIRRKIKKNLAMQKVA